MNAPGQLRIPTPDGSGQAVHPDVLYVPCGLLGYRYWMACTPYPYAADRLENPVLRVSHDGVRWTPFPGAPDPLVAAPPQAVWHHADTDLVLQRETLYVFYISTNRTAAETTFSYVSSTDGRRWSEPREIYRGTWGVSPALVAVEEGGWSMWYVFRDALSRSEQAIVYRRRGPDPASLGADEICELTVPGHVVWHIDVIRTGQGFEALVTAFASRTDPSRSRLFHATSSDGLRFRVTSSAPLIRPTWFGWDNRMVYRSTFIKRDEETYRIWYSAASWGMRCGIGLLEGPLDSLRAAPGHASDAASALPGRALEDVVGLAKYLVYRLLPASLYERLLAVTARLRTPRGAVQ